MAIFILCVISTAFRIRFLRRLVRLIQVFFCFVLMCLNARSIQTHTHITPSTLPPQRYSPHHHGNILAPIIHFPATMSIWHGSHSEARCIGGWDGGCVAFSARNAHTHTHVTINLEFPFYTDSVVPQRRGGRETQRNSLCIGLLKKNLFERTLYQIKRPMKCFPAADSARRQASVKVCKGCGSFGTGNELQEAELLAPPYPHQSLLYGSQRKGKGGWIAGGEEER